LVVNDNKIRVLCLITSLPLGGAEKSLLRLVRNSQSEIEYLVISLDSRRDLEGDFEHLNVKVINLNIKGLLSGLRGIPTLWKAIRSWRPNIIYCWMYHAMFLGVVLKILNPKIPMIWCIRHNNLDINLNKATTVFIAKFLIYCSRLPHKIVYCSQESLNFHNKIGYQAKHSILIENGFDPTEFSNKGRFSLAELESQKQKFFPLVNSSAILVGCCGRYDKLKRFENFVSTAQLIMDQDSNNVHFCLIGEGLPEKKGELLKNVFPAQKDYFHFIGATKNINEVFPCLDILVQTSFSESFPNVVAEAMLSGVAVVATDVGQTSKIIGSDGILVPPDNIAENCLAISRLILDREYLSRLQKGGVIRITKNFGIQSLVFKNIRMFRALSCVD